MKKAKFTLLELLVVVAIIGILMTLLMPSLQNARLAAKTALSMHNLKQIHTGTFAHVKNNNGKMFTHTFNRHPTTGNLGMNAVARWSKMAYDGMIGGVTRANHDAVYAKGGAYYKTFFCPVLRDFRPDPNKLDSNSDYSMNRYFGGKSYEVSRFFSSLSGDIEPLYVGGTTQNESQASTQFRYGTYNPEVKRYPAFSYTNKRAISLFIHGNVKFITKSRGAEIDAAIQSGSDFQ